jgi:hypothetical protein
MRTRGAIVCLAGCAALLASAQDAPLSNAKQQLQTLRKDQAAEKAKADSGLELRGALPTLATPAPEASLGLPSPLQQQREQEQKDARRAADARKNWLLDGYDGLDRKKGTGLGGDAEDAEDEVPLDPADPNYFLRVYERQRATNLAKQQADQRELKKSASAGPDAFAPLMQEWLANSPVRGALKDVLESGRRDSTTGQAASGRGTEEFAAKAADTGRGAAFDVGAPAPGRDSHAAPANPYLQALGLPGGLEVKRPEVGRSVATPVSPASAPAASSWSAPERPRAETNFRPPPSPADEKKYFPQLKKF